jgi:predicted nucleic acid-binding protein
MVSDMEAKRYEHHDGAIYPLVLSFGAKRTSDAQMKITRKIKERASRIEKAYKFALHDKVILLMMAKKFIFANLLLNVQLNVVY